MRRIPAALAAAVVLAVSLGAVHAAPAEAHERRQVGKYTLIVGWQSEPTTEGIPNATFLRVIETAADRGVEGLDQTLRLIVRSGGSSATFDPQLRPMPGRAGSYVGDIIPTRPGDYTFTVRGKVEELEVNEQFETGPGRFDVVRPFSTSSYPDKVIGPGDLARTIAELRDGITFLRIVAVAALALSALLLIALVIVARRGGAIALALAVAIAQSAPAAAAPAATVGLVRSDPAANSRVASPPATITLTFDEDIGGKSAARLLQPDGSVVATGPAKVDHTTLLLTPPALTPGTYVVAYTAVDPVDGHGFDGYLAFAVGSETQGALRGFDLSATAAGLTARLVITPGRAGENAYALTVAGADRATLRFEPTAVKAGTTQQQLQATAGAFSGKGMELALNGPTRITALVRRPGAPADTEIAFEVTVPAPAVATAAPAPSPTPTRTPAPTPTPTPLAAAPSPTSAPVAASGPGPLALLVALAVAAALAYLAWRRLGRRGT